MNKKYTVTDADSNYISDDSQIPDPTLSDADGSVGITRDPSDPVGVPGRRVDNITELGDQADTEKLVLEGVEQADTELQRAGRRKQD